MYTNKKSFLSKGNRKVLLPVIFLCAYMQCALTQNVIDPGVIIFQYIDGNTESGYYLNERKQYFEKIAIDRVTDTKAFLLDTIGKNRYIMSVENIEPGEYVRGNFMYNNTTTTSDGTPLAEDVVANCYFTSSTLEKSILSIEATRIGDTLYVTPFMDINSPVSLSILEKMVDLGDAIKIRLGKTNNFMFSYYEPESHKDKGYKVIRSEIGGDLIIDPDSRAKVTFVNTGSEAPSMFSIKELKKYSPIANGLSWKCENSTITISKTGAGNGIMPVYDDERAVERRPWQDVKTVNKVVVEEGVTSIGYYVFTRLKYLTEVSIPSTAEYIGDGAFYLCGNISGDMIIPEGVVRIGIKAFYGCRKITSLSLPSTLKSIESQAFYECSGISGKLVIPDGVVSIKFGAFADCDITDVVLPSAITTIEPYVFQYCKNLTNVFVKNPVPPTLGSHVFVGNTSLTAIYVPEGSEDIYKTAPGWSDYASMIQTDETVYEGPAYHRIGFDENYSDTPRTLEFSRFANNFQKLHEYSGDNKIDSTGNNLSFLDINNSVTDAGSTNYALYTDTAYINRGTGYIKPQYMFAVDTFIPNEGYGRRKYVIGRYLYNTAMYAKACVTGAGKTNFNKVMPVDHNTINSPHGNSYLIDGDKSERLAFAWAIHNGDSLYILKGIDLGPNYLNEENDPYELWLSLSKEYGVEGQYIDFDKLINENIIPGSEYSEMYNRSESESVMRTYYDFKPVTALSPGKTIGLHAIIALDDNTHKDWVFSLRLVTQEPLSFVIESETTERETHNGQMILPGYGGWLMYRNNNITISRTDSENLMSDPDVYTFTYSATDSPAVNNEDINTGLSVKTIVLGGTGTVSILNAAGKNVIISDMLGRTITKAKVSSDNATFITPSGVIAVAVEGEKAVMVVVK